MLGIADARNRSWSKSSTEEEYVMRTGFLAALGILLAGAGLSLADPGPVPLESYLKPGSAPGGEGEDCGEPECFFPSPCKRPPLLWIDAEYLLWWIKDGPLPVPLVTTGSGNDPQPGELGQIGRAHV